MLDARNYKHYNLFQIEVIDITRHDLTLNLFTRLQVRHARHRSINASPQSQCREFKAGHKLMVCFFVENEYIKTTF